MTFAIDTGNTAPQIIPKSATIDSTMAVRFTSWDRADRTKRQIIEAIEAFEDPAELDDYIASEDLMIDALHLFDPDMSEEIKDAHETLRAALIDGAANQFPNGNAVAPAPIPAIAQSQSLEKERPMFAIDTGDTGGSLGPWISWTSNGSAMKGFQPKKWILRGKDEAGNKTEEMVPAFETGCVMDLDSLKLGWEKDGATGMAPERRWNPSISQATPRPDESKKQSGAFAWSRALTVRLAIGGGAAATWEQGSFAAYAAFEKLAKQIQAQYPGDGRLPLVVQTGVEERKLPNGSANIPILEIKDWVQRPDCLKDDAPVIATGDAAPAAQPAPAPQPAPQPAASSVPASASF